LLFGYAKNHWKRIYIENSGNIEDAVADVMSEFSDFNETKIFNRCGYFYPST
jgi:hypothetical protein